MRVLHLISSLDPRAGGPPKALVGLAGAQTEQGLAVHVLSTTRSGDKPDYAETLKASGTDVTLVGPTRTPLHLHPDLKKAVEQGVKKADVVHIHGIWEHLQHLGAVVARKHGVPYLIRPCGMLDPWSLRQSRCRKRAYLALRLRRDLNNAAAIHYTTPRERDLAEPLGLKPQAIVEPNGIDLAEFDDLPPTGTFRDQHPQIGDRPMVLFLGRLHHKKGPDILIQAFAQAGLPDAVLVLAGPGEDHYLAQLKALVAKHGLEERVIFTGMLHGRDRIAAYADADLFCLPSHQENFGIAVVEALAGGTPVLISDQVNIFREVVDAGVGQAVPIDVRAVAEQLARSLRRVHRDDPVRANARAFVVDRYDWARIAERWSHQYMTYMTI
jgi:glycosyltransferase involved in cell wall biosynthesis